VRHSVGRNEGRDAKDRGAEEEVVQVRREKRLSRDQRTLDLLACDPSTGTCRAIVRETLRRSWALRAAYALVWGASANPEAKALYESAGLRSRRVLRDYRVGPPSSGSARSVQGAFLS